jgi:hypothetical protein
MSSEKDNTKRNLIIAGIALLLIISLALVFYFNGKAAGKRKGSINISTTPTDSSGNTASASQTEIKALAGDLYIDMKGANAFGHDLDPWKRWLAMSDTDFVRVGNAFNMDNEKNTGETIKQWVEGEQSWTQLDWKELKNTAINRMVKLNMQ